MADKPTIAVYLSSHGYGHCRRTGAVLAALAAERDIRIEVMGSAPQTLWPPALRSSTVAWRDEPCDVGVVQPDDLTVDHDATAAALERWARGYDDLVAREAARLAGAADLVIGDVPPLAFDAAAAADVRAVAIANFSWDWIYAEMGFDDASRAAAHAYEKALFLIELTPYAPMDAFVRRESVGIVGTPSTLGRERARRELGVRDDERVVLIGMRPGAGQLIQLPPPVPSLRYVWASEPQTRADGVVAPAELSFSDLLVGADAVVAKPGYGIIGDAAVAGTPMLYVERHGFPEDAVLLEWLGRAEGTACVTAESLSRGEWQEALERLFERGRVAGPARMGSEAAARVLAQALADRVE